MKGIRNRGFILGLMYCFEIFITRVSIFVSVLGFILLGNFISAKTMFTVTAIYAVLRPIITTVFSLGVTSVAEVNVSVKRIQEFLTLDEQNEVKLLLNESMTDKPRVFLDDITAKWSCDSLDPTLENITLDVSSNQLVAVIGSVGSGKSSLLNVILKELPIESGSVAINGEISYSSQEPWLFSASIRQNILFGDDNFDEERYKQVIKLCALDSDFKLLPFGDKTLVGEKGKALSGGQKARINLARCIYKKADIYLLDDPLSAVDANVGRHLYEKCIKEFLKDKICILVTHQLQYLNSAEKIIVMEDGKIEMEGNYLQLINSGLDFTKLVAQFQTDEEIKEDEKVRSIDNFKIDEEYSEDDPLLEKEFMESGSIKPSLYLQYFKNGGGLCNAFFMMLVFICAQVVASAYDYYVAFW